MKMKIHKFLLFLLFFLCFSFSNVFASEKDLEIYFKKDNINSAPCIYLYDGSHEYVGSWSDCPQMQSKGEYFYFKLDNVSSCYVVFKFSDGTQEPLKSEKGYFVSGKMKYENGTWSSIVSDTSTVSTFFSFSDSEYIARIYFLIHIFLVLWCFKQIVLFLWSIFKEYIF